jgi:hydroxypyruvate reductase
VAASLREDARAIGLAGVRAADPGGCTRAALTSPAIRERLASVAAVRVVAVGKASVAMWAAAEPLLPPVREALVIAPIPPSSALAPPARIHVAGHPLPTAGSHAAAHAALDLARRVGDDEWLVLLVSGGASALMAGPAGGVSLDDKVAATRALLRCGADIVEINTVRKHLSAVKGGRLARTAGGRCMTLALSDVIGAHEDDVSVIGSGPGVADVSTFEDARRIVEARGLRDTLPSNVVRRLDAGVRGEIDETPKPGEADTRDVVATVIGGRRDAMRGAADEAARRGYAVEVVEAPLLGEARDTAVRFVSDALVRGRTSSGVRRACVIASGETTVTVRGGGRGGRNQEFALAAALPLATCGRSAALLSLGTDGIDGPTDAAGGLVDEGTTARAAAAGVSIDAALADNDAYECLSRLGDLVVTGPTGTNVGDLVVITMA